uniref:ankyrin repeat and SOCS box protein 3 isoform X2 n=1 Tax=Myxine glutinosa TaxID=7769 RepID=UPI00358EA935
MNFSASYQDSASSVALAARSGNARFLRKLLRAQRPVDVCDNRGWRPLHEAAAAGHTACLKQLILADPSQTALDASSHEGFTALHIAAQNGHVACVSELIRAGANLNCTNLQDETPLFLAVEQGSNDVVQTLIAGGASVHGAQHWSGWTLLHQAAWKDHINLLNLLLRHGCYPEARDECGLTPLFVSAQYGQVRCLRRLIPQASQTNDGATPLFIAAQEGHEDCVRELLLAGASSMQACDALNCHTPLHAAAERGHVRLVALLASTITSSHFLMDPLVSAVKGGHPDCLDVLLKNGYRPRPCCHEFPNAMKYAVQLGHCRCISVFMAHGMRLTAYHLEVALLFDHPKTFRFLLFHNAPLPHCRDFATACSLLAQRETRLYPDLSKRIQWFLPLLCAGYDPKYLLENSQWLNNAELKDLVLIWKFSDRRTEPPNRLPPGTDLSLASLAHLSRLAVRCAVGLRLRGSWVCHLPVPPLLHSLLLFHAEIESHSGRIVSDSELWENEDISDSDLEEDDD